MTGKFRSGVEWGLGIKGDIKAIIYNTNINIILRGQALSPRYTSTDCNFFLIEDKLNAITFPRVAGRQKGIIVFFSAPFVLHPSQPVSYHNIPCGLSKIHLPGNEAKD